MADNWRDEARNYQATKSGNRSQGGPGKQYQKTSINPSPSSTIIPEPQKIAQVPDNVIYIDVDSLSGINMLYAWGPLIKNYEKSFDAKGPNDASLPDNYIIFAMNQNSLKDRKGPDFLRKLMEQGLKAKLSTIVVPNYSEEADNMIEGHLRQMMRLKEMIAVKCSSTSPWEMDKNMRYDLAVDKAGYYAKAKKPIKKRCDETDEILAARAQNYYVVSGDQDFQAIFEELKSTGSIRGTIHIYHPPRNGRNFNFNKMFNDVDNEYSVKK